DRVRPLDRLPRWPLPHPRRRRVRDGWLGRLVQQPAPPRLSRDAHPDRVRDAPPRGPQPRARTRKVAAENPGRFTWAANADKARTPALDSSGQGSSLVRWVPPAGLAPALRRF